MSETPGLIITDEERFNKLFDLATQKVFRPDGMTDDTAALQSRINAHGPRALSGRDETTERAFERLWGQCPPAEREQKRRWFFSEQGR